MAKKQSKTLTNPIFLMLKVNRRRNQLKHVNLKIINLQTTTNLSP